MTAQLEKQFFNVFGIEPKIKDLTPAQILYSDIERLEYPQITDRQYLELICILNDYGASYLSYRFKQNTDDLKNNVLTDLMFSLIGENNANKKMLKHQVQAIFEGER